jgi:site-specific DNA-methyltransferase (adenine-specific)
MKDYINITCEDNMALMARYPDGYFDLAIVDPPYGIGADQAQNGAAESRKKAKGKSKAGRGWKEYRATNWDDEVPKDEYFKELFRVSERQVIWGGNYFPFIWNYSNSFLLWNKMQREFSLADGELAWYSEANKAMRIFDFSRGGALANNNKNGGRFHPTQKPVALYQWLLKNYAKTGDKILDTHIGSGSIAIAVDSMNKVEGMNLTLTGCELDPEYYADAMKRIKAQTAQQSLFQ